MGRFPLLLTYPSTRWIFQTYIIYYIKKVSTNWRRTPGERNETEKVDCSNRCFNVLVKKDAFFKRVPFTSKNFSKLRRTVMLKTTIYNTQNNV